MLFLEFVDSDPNQVTDRLQDFSRDSHVLINLNLHSLAVGFPLLGLECFASFRFNRLMVVF